MRKILPALIGVLFFGGLLYLVSGAVFAATYYVSPGGSDTAAGSQTAPYKTFSKAISVLNPGDTLLILGGTYNQKLVLNRNGTATAPITVKSANTQTPVIIDLNNASGPQVNFTGSYTILLGDGIEARNSNGDCIDVNGQHNTLKNIVTHDCVSHGIYSEGQHNVIDGNTLYRSNLENTCRGSCGGWGSGIKLRVGANDILIQNNTVYHNYGEGIDSARGLNVTIRNNRVYDNFGVQIYVDNSSNVTISNNFVTCSPNSGFEYSTGGTPNGIAIGEESYSGWGAQLMNVTITNNISAFCGNGIVKWNSNAGTGGGIKGTNLFAYNTIWGTVGSGISFAHDSGDQTLRIANNIVNTNGTKSPHVITTYSGMTIDHNFWVNASTIGTGDLTGSVPTLALAATPGYDINTYRLSANSRARNAAATISSVSTDFEGKNRYTSTSPNGDMGALEFDGSGTPSSPAPSPTNVPSATPVTSPAATPTVNFDVNGDGVINFLDLKALIIDIFKTISMPVDFNHDGVVNSLDFAYLLQRVRLTLASPTPVTASPTPGATPIASPSSTPRASASATPAASASPITNFSPRPAIASGVFNGTGSWNTPASQIPVDTAHTNLVSLFYNSATASRPGNVNLGFGAYTYPVYVADASTPLVAVSGPSWSSINGKNIPYNTSWQPSSGSDGQMIVIDPTRKNYYDMWQFSFNGSRISVSNGSILVNYPSLNGQNPGSRGCGIAYFNMLVTPEDVASGTIKHALSMSGVRNTASTFVAPATKSDGHTSGGIPEGTRFALTMTNAQIEAWVATKRATYQSFARKVAYALRDYGWIITDTGGGAFLQFEDIHSAGNVWPVVGVTNPTSQTVTDLMDGLDWAHAVVLQPR